MIDGVKLIAAERERQVSEERWTPEHDDTHTDGELVAAARCYLTPPGAERNVTLEVVEAQTLVGVAAVPRDWPWEPDAWKPPRGLDRIRELTKAGALIAAEIDRLQRADCRLPVDTGAVE